MTRPFLYAAWLLADGGGERAIAAYVDAISAWPGAGTPAAYELLPKTPVLRTITDRLAHTDVESYAHLPDVVVLAETDSLDAALDLDARLQTTPATVVVRGIYREVVAVAGTSPAPADGFGPVIQLGTFAMPSAADEWAVTEWYRTRRLPSFSASPGSIRVRRFVSACGGPAKLAVLYEFTSLEDRAAHFEPLELVDHDETRPTAAARTIHPPMSPGIGAALDVG
ncbi:MAG TPA: hypothetical protein VK891_08230 [Euzebyales bacterium]|nr:hypothetical protein [Euzebyales bacterium]